MKKLFNTAAAKLAFHIFDMSSDMFSNCLHYVHCLYCSNCSTMLKQYYAYQSEFGSFDSEEILIHYMRDLVAILRFVVIFALF